MRSENARDPTIVPLGRDFEDNSTVTKAKLYYLQYSGYGYQGRGVPYWLLQWVRERMEAGAVVGTFFHELYAFGPPWRSSFWLSPFQRDIAAKLAGASTFWLTNREASARWLAGAAGDKPNAVLPVFSNVGEQEILAGGKSNRGVVFGNEAARCAVYRTGGLELFAWADRHDVKIHDVGDPISDPVLSKRLDELGVVKHGRLAREEVHQMLCTAKVGFLKYPLAYITKSGMFAAYCSHGMCPIVLSPRPVNTDGLTEGFITSEELNC